MPVNTMALHRHQDKPPLESLQRCNDGASCGTSVLLSTCGAGGLPALPEALEKEARHLLKKSPFTTAKKVDQTEKTAPMAKSMGWKGGAVAACIWCWRVVQIARCAAPRRLTILSSGRPALRQIDRARGPRCCHPWSAGGRSAGQPGRRLIRKIRHLDTHRETHSSPVDLSEHP